MGLAQCWGARLTILGILLDFLDGVRAPTLELQSVLWVVGIQIVHLCC
jgi:hypothetical protein